MEQVQKISTKSDSYKFLGAIYPINKRSFYFRLLVVTCVFLVALGTLTYLGYSFFSNFKVSPFL